MEIIKLYLKLIDFNIFSEIYLYFLMSAEY